MNEPRAVPSAVSRVTLFEDRAEVVRRARVSLRGGRELVAIDGVSAAVDDPSVVVRVDYPGVRVLGTRVGRRVVTGAAASSEELAAMEADRARASEAARAALQAVARGEAEQRRAEQLLEAWTQAVGRAPHDAAGAAGEAWRAGLAALDAAAARALEAAASAREAQAQAAAELARAEARLELARRQEPKQETRVLVEVDAELGDEVPLELVYRVPCAMWRPEHRAALHGDQVEITTYATVWQSTGEAWTDVPLHFSTARPARIAEPPLLTDDVLALRKKTQEERRVVIVEAREQAIQRTGVGGARAVEEMPGVDDGGEPLAFAALSPATVLSDGAPCRVEIATTRLAAVVDRVVMPELSPVAHLRARLVNRAATPLLAGPLALARGGALVGRSRLGFVAVGEPFEIGFGPDDGLRVRARRDTKRETAAITGTQRVTRTVTLYLSNTSSAARALVVVERYPVSELGEVTVEVVKAGGAKLDAREGLARFEVELEARSTRELELVYRVEAPSKVSLRI